MTLFSWKERGQRHHPLRGEEVSMIQSLIQKEVSMTPSSQVIKTVNEPIFLEKKYQRLYPLG